MKIKKTVLSIFILMDEIEFQSAEQASNPQELEDCLKRLMKDANKHYDAVYKIYKNNPDIEKFSICKENFKKIKSIIESKENLIQLTNKLYFSAWISMLYSEVHALNLQPKTEAQLGELNEKILAIDIDFKKLIEKSSSLSSNNKSADKLLKYIGEFEKTWKTKKNRLKGHYYYNFANYMLAGIKSNEIMKKAVDALEKASLFYMHSGEQRAQTETDSKIAEIKEMLDQLRNLSGWVVNLERDKQVEEQVKGLKLRQQTIDVDRSVSSVGQEKDKETNNIIISGENALEAIAASQSTALKEGSSTISLDDQEGLRCLRERSC